VVLALEDATELELEETMELELDGAVVLALEDPTLELEDATELELEETMELELDGATELELDGAVVLALEDAAVLEPLVDATLVEELGTEKLEVELALVTEAEEVTEPDAGTVERVTVWQLAGLLWNTKYKTDPLKQYEAAPPWKTPFVHDRPPEVEKIPLIVLTVELAENGAYRVVPSVENCPELVYSPPLEMYICTAKDISVVRTPPAPM
jgi:hypothetical protein